MSVKLHIHPFLMHITGNKDLHEVTGITIGECLEDLVGRYPDLREWIFTPEGKLNNMFELYHNMESAMPEGLAQPVRDGDEINLIVVIAGG